MHLLDPSEITQEKKIITEQSQSRARSAAIEESRIVKNLNLVKQQAEEAKNKIKEETDAFMRDQEEKRDIARKEAEEAENRRKEAMIPINEIKIALEAKIEAVEQREQAVKEEKEQIAVDKQKNIELAERLADEWDDIKESKKSVDQKMKNVELEEIRITESAKALGSKWAEYNKAVETLNKLIKENKIKEDELKATEKAQADRKEYQDKIATEQSDRDRAINDKYNTLIDTVKKVKKMYNINIKL